MGFYEQISKYYDYIFPAGKNQIKFIKESAGLPPKKVLDVACGSGGYSIELGKTGYDITAVDLEAEMVNMAREKAKKAGLSINAMDCDMRKLEDIFKPAEFDCIFCIGNSIVHMGSLQEIQKVLKQMRSILKDNGTVIIQTINYDRIIKQKVSTLPLITDSSVGLEFTREYEYESRSGLINFNTTMIIDGNGTKQRYENSIKLFPVMSGDMAGILKAAGFSDITLYGDFEYSPYDENSFMTVVKAV